MTNNVTYYESLYNSTLGEFKSIYDIINEIKTCKYKDKIDALKGLSPDKYKKAKENLPGVCFNGEFSKRSNDGLINHNGFAILDFDKFENEEITKEFKDQKRLDSFVFAVWTSPSRKGLKILVKIPKCITDLEYKTYYKALMNKYDCKYLDKNTSDISRFCFVSYDQDIYININSKEFDEKIEDKKTQEELPKIEITASNEDIIETVKDWLKVKSEDKKNPLANTYKYIDGNRNNYIFKFSSACNRFGLSKQICLDYLLQYDLEDKEVISVVNHSYSDTESHGKERYYDKEFLSAVYFYMKKNYKEDKIKAKLISKGLDEESSIKLIEYIRNKIKDERLTFWTVQVKVNEKEDKAITTVLIDPEKYINWLVGKGIYRYMVSEKVYYFVYVRNNIVEEIQLSEIKNLVFNYINILPESFDNISRKTLYDYVYKNHKTFFSEENLILLDVLPNGFIRDGKDYSYIFYKNLALKITKKSVDEIPYNMLKGFIWKSQILDREYDINIDCEPDFDFYKFISNIFPQNLDSIMTIIGYMLHNYKDPSKPYCPVLNDEILEDGSNGGTGKGLIVKAIGKIRNVLVLDGKNWTTQGDFSLSSIESSTNIIFIDDASHNFKFESLFSLITEGLMIRKLYTNPYRIDYKDSPKFIVSTNFALKGDGGSHNRRKIEVELTNYYTNERTPEKEFKRLFFEEWNKEEWNKFDTFMIKCIYDYLNLDIINPELKNLSLKRLINQTNKEFVDFAESHFKLDFEYVTSEYLGKYMVEAHFNKLTTQTFNKFVKYYSVYKQYDLVTGRKTNLTKDAYFKFILKQL